MERMYKMRLKCYYVIQSFPECMEGYTNLDMVSCVAYNTLGGFNDLVKDDGRR